MKNSVLMVNIYYDSSGIKLKFNPINQATHQAQWLEQQLSDSHSKNFSIMPVVIFPGWHVRIKIKDSSYSKNVKILSTTSLEKLKAALLESSPVKNHLTAEDVTFVCNEIRSQIKNMPEQF